MCQIRDDINVYESPIGDFCDPCNKYGHNIKTCPVIHFSGRRDMVIWRHIFNED
jgi:hypothetical protein